MDLGAEFGAKIFVLWGGREGAETDACRRPDDAVKRLREAINYLCEYSIDQKYGYKFAMEAKPNEPRGDIYMATTGNYLGLIPTLDHPRNGRRKSRSRARNYGRTQFRPRRSAGLGRRKTLPHRSQRSGTRSLRSGFPLRLSKSKSGILSSEVLRRVGYKGSRHFDAHAYRTEDYAGVKDFAAGCMRTYLILKEKAARFNADSEIQAILKEINEADKSVPSVGAYSRRVPKNYSRTRSIAPRWRPRDCPTNGSTN